MPLRISSKNATRKKNLIQAYKDEITPCKTKINKIKTTFIILVLVYFRVPIFVFSYGDFRYPVYSSGVISSFRATIFRLFVWRLFVISSYFVLSRGVVSHGVCTTFVFSRGVISSFWARYSVYSVSVFSSFLLFVISSFCMTSFRYFVFWRGFLFCEVSSFR